MTGRLGFVVPIFLAALASSVAPAAAQQAAEMDPAIVARVGAALAGDRVAEPPPTTRAITRGGPLTQLYWANVQNAPVAVVDGGTGSATVIIVHPNRQAYVLTNNHVAEGAFTVKGRPPQVFLLFYDAALKNEIFDHDRFLGCFNSSHDQTAWCRAVRNSSRLATLIATDPTRDLALLSVIMPFSKDRDRWLNTKAIDTQSGEQYAITLLDPKGRTRKLEVKCYGNILGAYREHPEAKFLGHDGQPCDSLTRGLLRRSHIVAGAHRYIGKETSRR